jgi:UDP-4-amino-4-deoxy-L-arabinose formyltransferase/UDP-glucuronic acid dehydrogenase (UDP-4-keto-hexauronic acid decarboxylating)
VLVPPGGDINHPHFIARLRNEIRPTIALSFYCLQKFSPDLLAVFGDAVNYHNGFLPEYRGLRATAWSVYREEKETGFTFHRMTREFDEGAILVQRAIPTGLDQSTTDLEALKAIKAATYIPHVLDMVVDGAPGEPQRGKGSYFSKENYLAVAKIPDPSALSSTELMRRLRAFGGLWMRIGDTWHVVTKIRQVPDRSGKGCRACFRASDGVMIKVLRFGYIPYPIYMALVWIRKWFPRKVTS